MSVTVHCKNGEDGQFTYERGDGYQGLRIGEKGTDLFIFLTDETRLALIRALSFVESECDDPWLTTESAGEPPF
jgi:hypothetical protein